MGLQILEAGPQASLQGAPRNGFRHYGVPSSGPADPLSLAFANRLVGNAPTVTGIEITYGPFAARFLSAVSIGLAGAVAPVRINGVLKSFHETLRVDADDLLEIGLPTAGLRTYLGISGGVQADEFLGSTSSYLPAEIGGYGGRALKKGDTVGVNGSESRTAIAEQTPEHLQFPLGNSFALRASEGPDFERSCQALWDRRFTVTRRASRIGVELEGEFPKLGQANDLPSAGIFPGALQLPPGGRGYLLLPDCQTTGGYPHILQVNRSDRHLLGQIRPGDSIMFLHRTPEAASDDLAKKKALIRSWIKDIEL